ncbi:MAG: hypothetical protein WBP11_06085 [Dokdonella sp.]
MNAVLFTPSPGCIPEMQPSKSLDRPLADVDIEAESRRFQHRHCTLCCSEKELIRASNAMRDVAPRLARGAEIDFDQCGALLSKPGCVWHVMCAIRRFANSRSEEKRMLETFADEYRSYRSQLPMIFQERANRDSSWRAPTRSVTTMAKYARFGQLHTA